jgi:hypothetical protein
MLRRLQLTRLGVYRTVDVQSSGTLLLHMNYLLCFHDSSIPQFLIPRRIHPNFHPGRAPALPPVPVPQMNDVDG